MKKSIVEQSDVEIIRIAEPLLQNLLDGADALDYEKFTRDFSHGMKTVMPRDLFMEQTIGLQRIIDHQGSPLLFPRSNGNGV